MGNVRADPDTRLSWQAPGPAVRHLSAFVVVDGGEQRGVGADQRGVLQREQRPVRLTAFPDPLIGQVHRPGPVRRPGAPRPA